ncbi:MAG: four helix bundle protein [bacterium]|nr:four helix bundle protein [bacterium]
MKTKIHSFTDLFVWKEAHTLALIIYKMTKTFPSDEKFALVDQMRRCVISITSNIAEGFSRQGKKEKIQFYYVAKGSLTELQNQLLLARDLGYIDQKLFVSVAETTVIVHKLLNKFIVSAQEKV